MSERPDGYVKSRLFIGFWALLGVGITSLLIRRTLAAHGYAVPYAIVILLIVVLVLPVLIASLIEEQQVPATILEDPGTQQSFPDADDAVRQAVTRWDRRLDLRHDDMVRANSVRALLVDLVSDRLQLSHGVDPAGDPDRALALVGPRVRALLTQPPRSMRPNELIALIAEMEQL